MTLSQLATVTDGLMESEQLFPEPPLFLSMMMGTWGGSGKVGSLSIQPPEAAASPTKLY